MIGVLAALVVARPVLTGLDVLERDGFASLRGKRVGLITNQTGIDREGRRNVDVMRKAGVNLVALFSPEHGLFGREDHPGIPDDVDPATGLKVYSLYGDAVRPTPESLKGLDALVFDIADVGVRFYTYKTTMAYGLEAAAKAGIEYMVLDRPNPIGGVRVEGPTLDAPNVSFTGYFAGEPVRHGMTLGELARMFDGEGRLAAKLTVVPLEGWRRKDWFDDTGLPWVNPSPNMRSLKAAILYPGLCMLEFARNPSVGRGTDDPFEQVGADWIDGIRLAKELNARGLPGLRFYPVWFTPTEGNFKGVRLGGVRVEITDRDRVESVRTGIEIAATLQRLYPGHIDWSRAKRTWGSDETIRRISAGESPPAIEAANARGLEAFKAKRAKYLLYR